MHLFRYQKSVMSQCRAQKVNGNIRVFGQAAKIPISLMILSAFRRGLKMPYWAAAAQDVAGAGMEANVELLEKPPQDLPGH
jgi:hypothetical protein